jgi:hypothetical protein
MVNVNALPLVMSLLFTILFTILIFNMVAVWLGGSQYCNVMLGLVSLLGRRKLWIRIRQSSSYSADEEVIMP